MSLLDRLATGLRPRIPVLLQTEASECGLACIGMLLARFGTVTDLATLRGRHGAMPQGMTVADIVRVASQEQLATRAVRLKLREISNLRLPCILHWDLGHFVVLTRISGDSYEIIDPAFGERTLKKSELSPRFSGIAIEAWPNPGFKPKDEAQRVSYAQLIGQVSGLWPTLWRVMALSLGLEVLTLVAPLFMQGVVDHVLVSRDVSLLGTLGVGFLLLLVFEQFLSVVRSWLLLRVSAQLRVQWRSNVLAHLMRLPLDYFARRHLGDVMSRYGSIGTIQDVLTSVVVETALDGLMVVLALSLMFLYSPMLTGVAVLAVALYVAVRLAWYGPLRRATAERIVRSAAESSHLLETVRGMRTIRLFARQEERLGAWQSLMVADLNAKIQIQKLEIGYRLARRTLSGVFALLLLWLGAREVMAGQFSVGMLLAFLAYRGQFDSRFSALVDTVFELRILSLDAQRLADIVLTPAESDTRGRGVPTLTGPPTITFDEVRFRYAAGSPEVLAGLNLHVPGGQAVAIAGSSGCGKSTLVSLLLGVYKPTQGRILINGQPLDSIGLDAWRAQVGTVMQDDVLFAGSIAENIAFFDSGIDRAWVEQCARSAAIHDDIMGLPMGYQTLVGDMGTSLSGGQKQRVLLARALYRRPQVLILDEATSHLDVAREAEVGHAIAAMPLTRIVVAHRPQTLALVDRVVALHQGQVQRDELAADYRQRHAL
jgi:ATP-binding cassette, subfamily B, bacterial CvaB/MchF/RaxB